MPLAVAGSSRAIDAVCAVRLDNGDDGTLRSMMRGKIARDCPRQRADPRLQKDVCWHVIVLLHRLMCERGVALHDPTRDLRIAVKRRVLHEHPAALLRKIRCMAHGVIVVVRCKRCLRTEPADVRQTLGRAALGHKDMSKQAKDLRRPRDAASVVAVRRRHERDLAQLFTVLRLRKVLIGHRALREPQILREIACDRIARPEPLERVQPKPTALILDRKPPEPQPRRKAFEVGKRCRCVVRQPLMKRGCTRRHAGVERSDIRTRAVRMHEMYRLDGFIHRRFLPTIIVP